MKQRIITAAFLIGIVVPIVYFGGIPFKIMAVLFIAIGAYELLRLFDNKWPETDKIIICLFFVIALVLGFFNIKWLLAASCLFVIYLFQAVIFNENITVEQIGLTFLIYLILESLVLVIEYLQNADKAFLFLMLVGTYLTDAFALFCGKAFGKHKLNERISPNKTIEGSIGGYIITSIVCLILGLLTVKNIPLQMIVVASFTYTLVGQIGDLAFSAIKRYYNVKDFGNIFPGHGGVLDRIDSLTFNCLWTICLVVIFL